MDIIMGVTAHTFYIKKDPSMVLEAAECLKKKQKYLQPCLDQRHHVIPLLVSVDGLIGKEVKMVLQILAARTVTKA
jgi:hypothetical protein